MNLTELRKICEAATPGNNPPNKARLAYVITAEQAIFCDTFNPALVAKLLDLWEVAKSCARMYSVEDPDLIDALAALENDK